MKENNFKVKVETENQLDIVIGHKNVSDIIISRDSFAEKNLPKLVKKIKSHKKNAWILMERISRFEEKMSIGAKSTCRGESIDLRLSTDKIYEIADLDGIIIQNLDSFAYMLRRINKIANNELKIELNYTMNCYNSETKLVLERIYNDKRSNAKDVPLLFTAPVELNIYELSDVGYDTMILYSYIDTMVTANCLNKNTKAESKSSYILDRKNKKLHYKAYCKYCYNKIFNTEPLFLLDKIGDIAGPSYRIDFSFESDKEVKSILSGTCPESFTRGHYKTSIK